MLMLMLGGACEASEKDLDEYIDACAERGDATCKCVWDLVEQAHPSQDACYDLYDVTDKRRECTHRALGDDDRDVYEILHCRVSAENTLASCYSNLCDKSKEGKMTGIGDCLDLYSERLQDCEALPASTKEVVMDCLQD